MVALRKGSQPAKGTVPTAKGITIAIFAAISQAWVIDISEEITSCSYIKEE
jgi:hypothetical protein